MPQPAAYPTGGRSFGMLPPRSPNSRDRGHPHVFWNGHRGWATRQRCSRARGSYITAEGIASHVLVIQLTYSPPLTAGIVPLLRDLDNMGHPAEFALRCPREDWAE